MRWCSSVFRAARFGSGAVAAAILLFQVSGAQAQVIDPAATALLQKSTDFLAAQQSINADTRNSFEVVLKSGQKIQFNHTASLTVQRPNKLRVERSGDLVKQVFYYDGKSLTLENTDRKLYATVAAPATIDATLDFARESLDVVAPAGDLLYRDAYNILMEGVTTAFVVGKGYIEGSRCDHLAFSAPHADWQIWIEDGKTPLIRKMVITTKDVVNAPQFELVVTKWDFKSKPSDKRFVFSPQPGSKKIEFLSASGK